MSTFPFTFIALDLLFKIIGRLFTTVFFSKFSGANNGWKLYNLVGHRYLIEKEKLLANESGTT